MAQAVSARRIRAAVLAGASLLLGLIGHYQAGGHSLTATAMLLATGFCVLSALAYSRRRLSGPAVAGLLLGNQLVLHVGLTLGATGAAASGSSHPGHVAADHAGLVPSVGMILAHLVATVLTAVTIVVVEAS